MDVSSLTSLPTDSLYKFMAIFGILILFAGATLPSYFRKKIFFQLLESKRDIDMLSARMTHFESFSDDLMKKVMEIEVRASKRGATDAEKSLSDHYVQQLNDKTLEIKLSVIEQNCAKEKADHLFKEGMVLRIAQVASVASGLLLIAAGFYLWYVRIQVFIDASMLTKSS